MTTDQIKSIQSRVGAVADGVFGSQSRLAVIKHLRRLMPTNSPWPNSNQAALRAFYGEPGDESNLIQLTFPFPMFYDGKLVKATRVNKKCAESLYRVLTNIGKSYGTQKDKMDPVQDYSGVFNFRLKRGGSTYSLHAYGAAIDLDADDNTFRDKWPTQADMPLEIMEEFAKEGWISAGAFWGYDAMHFQATRE